MYRAAAVGFALALGRRGYRMIGVDWSSEFLSHAAAADAAREVTWEQRDMRDLPWRARFGGAVCVGNSFGYLDDTVLKLGIPAGQPQPV